MRDRIVQTAVLLVLEPIFEADFLEVSFGFWPRRKAHDALAAIRKEIRAGRREVYDADLKGFFDSIPWDKLFEAPRTSLDFLGYTFRFDRDLKGRNQSYLNVFPSKKALARGRAAIRAMTSSDKGFVPVPVLIASLNRHLRGWANYFSFGYPSQAKHHINWFVQQRLKRHLRR